MRIIQLTDLHIGADDEDTYGVDVRQNFLDALAICRERQPDLVVISGDFCFKAPQEHIYTWVKEALKDLGIPIEYISGNHDNPQWLAKAFELEAYLDKGELYFSKQINGHSFLFLDTTKAVISIKQHQWIEKELQASEGNVFIFMHHPPMKANVPFMDNKHNFKDDTGLIDLFKSYLRPINIFTGHYHLEKSIHLANIAIHITPAVFYQISSFTKHFSVDHRRPAYRLIEINGDTLLHSVHYFEPNSYE